MLSLERGKYLGGVEGADGCNAEMALGRLAVRRQQFMGFIAEFHDAAGELEQRRAGFGQLDLPRLADQKLHAVDRLELLYLDGEGRLADVQDTRGRREAALRGNGMKRAELAEHY